MEATPTAVDSSVVPVQLKPDQQQGGIFSYWWGKVEWPNRAGSQILFLMDYELQEEKRTPASVAMQITEYVYMNSLGHT